MVNPDRHTNNFGQLRDINTGKYIGLAPNYVDNMALIARGYPSKPKKNDALLTLFNELTDEFPEYSDVIPVVTGELIRSVISELNMKLRTQSIVDIVFGHYELVKR